MDKHDAIANSEKDGAFSPERIRDLIDRAFDGDESTAEELRAVYDRFPELCAAHSIETLAKKAIVKPFVGKSVAHREANMRMIERVAADLAGPTATSIERLLADRAALCWFLVNNYERQFASQTEMSFRQAEYFQDLIDRTHTRYLRALKTLATVRKLALPALQINIGKKQVNVAGG